MTTAWDAIKTMILEALDGVNAVVEAKTEYIMGDQDDSYEAIGVYMNGGRVFNAKNPCGEIPMTTDHARVTFNNNGILYVVNMHTLALTYVDPAEEGFQHTIRRVVDESILTYEKRCQGYDDQQAAQSRKWKGSTFS